MKREIAFEIQEIKTIRDPLKGRYDYVHTTKGVATIDGEEIEVFVEDETQPYGGFIATDNFFKKLIKKIAGG